MLEVRIEDQPYGTAGIPYQGTELYESWTTLLLHTILRTRAFGALNISYTV